MSSLNHTRIQITGTPKDFSLAWAWTLGVCISVLGVDKGKQFAQTLSAPNILQAWIKIVPGEA